MNKITVAKDNVLTELETSCVYHDQTLKIQDNCDVELSFTDSKMPLSIEVEENITVSINITQENSHNKLNYTLLQNSKTNVFHMALDCSNEITVDLKKEQASIAYCYSTMNKNKNTLLMTVNHNQSMTESNVTCHGVNLKDNALLFQIDGVVPKKSKNCICNQDSKIIELEKNASSIKPNLLIDNYDVEASHAAYIGKFHEEDLFYLMSRGISKEKSYDLLLEGFLLGNKKIAQDVKQWFLNFKR